MPPIVAPPSVEDVLEQEALEWAGRNHRHLPSEDASARTIQRAFRGRRRGGRRPPPYFQAVCAHPTRGGRGARLLAVATLTDPNNVNGCPLRPYGGEYPAPHTAERGGGRFMHSRSAIPPRRDGDGGADAWHAGVEREAERVWGGRPTRPSSSPASAGRHLAGSGGAYGRFHILESVPY
jgi:hypothetical protein